MGFYTDLNCRLQQWALDCFAASQLAQPGKGAACRAFPHFKSARGLQYRQLLIGEACCAKGSSIARGFGRYLIKGEAASRGPAAFVMRGLAFKIFDLGSLFLDGVEFCLKLRMALLEQQRLLPCREQQVRKLRRFQAQYLRIAGFAYVAYHVLGGFYRLYCRKAFGNGHGHSPSLGGRETAPSVAPAGDGVTPSPEGGAS